MRNVARVIEAAAMKNDFDLHRILDIPDPLENVARAALPPQRPQRLDRSLTHTQVARSRITALIVAVLYEAVWLAMLNKRGDLASVPRTTFALEIAAPLVAAALAIAAATGPGAHGIGQPKARLTTLVLSSPALFALATLLLAPADVDEEFFWPHALRCFLLTSLFAAGPLVLAVWSFRHSFVAVPAWRTAALGLACAALGAVTMSFLCSVGSAPHVLVGHGGVLLVGGAIGAALGGRFGRV
jgi:hypothetical protein